MSVIALVASAVALAAGIYSATLNQPNAQVREEIESLKQRLGSLTSLLFEDRMKIALLEIQGNTYASTSIDPSETKGFRRIDTSIGQFLVSLQSVTPYLDGVRVYVRVGNTSYATFNGFTMTAKWGSRFIAPTNWIDFSDTYSSWTNSLKSKTFEFTDTLNPGTWNPVDFVLPSVDPRQFGHLQLSMDAKGVSLFTGMK